MYALDMMWKKRMNKVCIRINFPFTEPHLRMDLMKLKYKLSQGNFS